MISSQSKSYPSGGQASGTQIHMTHLHGQNCLASLLIELNLLFLLLCKRSVGFGNPFDILLFRLPYLHF